MKTINDLFTQTSGKALKKTNQNGTLHKYITTSNLFWGRFDFSEVREMYFMDSELEKCTAKKGDLLVCNGGDVGRSAVWEYDYDICLQNHVTRLRPKSSDVFPKYYYYVMFYIKNNDLINGNGVGIASLSAKELMSIQVPHPSLDEQKKIASHLDTIQAAIDNKKQQFQQLDELVKSKFVEMFGDVNLNDKNFDTEIGKNLFKFSSGKFLSAEFRLESGIPVYGGNGIAWYTEKPLIEYSTIIIGRVGAYCGNVKLVTEPVWITDNALFIKEFKTSRFNLQFLIKLMENINFAKYAGKVAQPKITQGPLEEQVYIIPPIELQNIFAEYVQKIDSAKSIIKTQLVDLQELIDSKMNEYFGG